MTTDTELQMGATPPTADTQAPPADATSTAAPTPVPTPTADAAPTATVWPSDWREQAAAGDEKLLKTLARYNSPVDGLKAVHELRTKLSSGEYKKATPAPDAADSAALAEWRKENGVPDVPEAYDLKMPDGVVIGADDKPFVDQFLKAMHERNMPAGPVKEAVAAYFSMQEKARADAIQSDRAFAQETEEALRAEWGHEFLPNRNLAENFAVTRFGDEVGKAMMEAGPDVVKALAAISREINPAMTLVPNSNNPTQAIDDELASLNKMIGTPEWYRSPDKQARYQQLLAGQDAMKRRG